MRTLIRHITVALFAGSVAVATACTDQTGPSLDAPVHITPRLTIAVPSCFDLTDQQVRTLITNVYTYLKLTNSTADALGLWSNTIYPRTDITAAQAGVWRLTNQMLQARQSTALPDTPDMKTLINALYCWVKINVSYPGGDAWVVPANNLATSQPTTLLTADKQAALYLPVGSITEQSLIAVTSTTDTLKTDLDKYPIVRQFSKYPNSLFGVPASLAICGNAWTEVLPNLRLGHNLASGGFEILPIGQNTSLAIQPLVCDPNILASRSAPLQMMGKLLAMALPKWVFAQTSKLRGTSGIGGDATALSPIGPVDRRIVVSSNASLLTSGTINYPVTPPPSVTLRTPNGVGPNYTGRLLRNVLVGFGVTGGGGTLSPTSVTSDTNGVAAVTYWTMGPTAGVQNTAVATPTSAANTTAVPGTVFTPSAATFSVTPTNTTNTIGSLKITGGPASGANVTAGTSVASTTVTVLNSAGGTATDFKGTVTLSASNGAFGGTASVAAVNGIATFSAATAVTAGTSLTLVATTAAGGKPVIGRSATTFNVVPATAARIIKFSGDSQTFAEGTVVGSTAGTKPTIIVADAFGNAIGGVTMYFGPSNNNSAVGSASVASSKITGAVGQAGTTWTFQVGRNNLVASLDKTGSISAKDTRRWFEFVGTGTAVSTTSGTPVLTCAAGTYRDSIAAYGPKWVLGANETAKYITNVKLRLSLPGGTAAMVPLRLDVKVVTAAGATTSYSSAVSQVLLNGDAKQDKDANFYFATTPILTTGATVTFALVNTSTTAYNVQVNTGTGSYCSTSDISVIRRATNALYRQGASIQVYAK